MKQKQNKKRFFLPQQPFFVDGQLLDGRGRKYDMSGIVSKMFPKVDKVLKSLSYFLSCEDIHEICFIVCIMLESGKKTNLHFHNVIVYNEFTIRMIKLQLPTKFQYEVTK